MEWWAITLAFNTFSFSFLCSVMEVRGIRVNCGKLLHYADLLKVEANTLWSTAKPVCFPQSWRERREKVKNMSTLNNLMTMSRESTESRAGRRRGKHLGNLLLGYTDYTLLFACVSSTAKDIPSWVTCSQGQVTCNCVTQSLSWKGTLAFESYLSKILSHTLSKPRLLDALSPSTVQHSFDRY